jgi:LysM repeat protein
LNILAKKIDELQRRILQVSTKNRTRNTINDKPAFHTKDIYHDVHKDDTLFWIAKKFGISVYELFCLNQIAPNQVIRPGQRLLIGPGTRQ